MSLAPRSETESALPWAGTPLREDGESLASQIYQQLREAIVQGRVAPGESLREPLIAKTFGISRTPVREALLKLRDNGLVEIKRQSGTYVSEIDPALVEEGMLVREALEPRVAQVAAERISSAQLDALSRATDRMAAAIDAEDSAGFIDADDGFHRLIIEASGYAHVAQIIDRVNAPLDRLRYLSVSEPIRAQTAVQEHRKLIEHLQAGNGLACEALLAEHLRGSWVVIRDLLVSTRD